MPHQENFVHKNLLPNGLRVLVHEMPWAGSVSARLLVNAGPRYEDSRTTGSAHYLEHMFFEGSKKHPSRRELDRALESRGGDHSAYTEKEYAMYQAKVPADEANFAVQFVRDLVFNPAMTEEAVQREKGIISSELRKWIDTAGWYRWTLLREHVWPGHPLGHNTLGTFESIDGITRDDLVDYQDRFYRPDNSVLVIAGNIKSTDAVNIAADNLGDLQRSTRPLPVVKAPAYSATTHVKIEDKDLKQAHVLLAFDTNGEGENGDLLARINVLSKMIRNVLFHKFVYEKGIAYSAGSFPWLVSDGGCVAAYAEVSPENIDQAVEMMVCEVKNLKIDQDTINEARVTVASEATLNLADTDDYAHFIGEQELHSGRVKSPEEMKQSVMNVSVDEVQEMKDELIVRETAALVVLGQVSQARIQEFDDMLVF